MLDEEELLRHVLVVMLRVLSVALLLLFDADLLSSELLIDLLLRLLIW